MQDNDIAEWVDTINVNLTGTFLVCRAVVPVMIGQGGGKIINLSGAGVANAWSNMSAYCSSKAAVVRLTEVLAQELEGKGITVNALGPGSVHTSMWEKMTEQAPMQGLNSSTNWARGCSREVELPLTTAPSWPYGSLRKRAEI